MKLFVRKMGDGDPLVILHGLFGLSDNWLNIAKELAKTHRCYLLDLRNHGRSPQSENHDYDDMVEDLYEFLTDFGLRTVSVMGHSMGGLTAMKFALEYPHRVNKLVVVDIAPRSYPVMHQNILAGLKAIPIASLKSRKEGDQVLKNYVDSVKIRQFLLKNIYRNEDNTYAWRINLDAITAHTSDIGRGITGSRTFDKPTLFIRGGKSEYINDEDEARINEIFSDHRIIIIPNASHWVHAEEPKAFLEAVNNFL